MKIKYLSILLPFIISSCNNISSSSSDDVISSSDFIMPNFTVTIFDSRGAYFYETLDQDKTLNLNSRYRLVLETEKDAHPLFNECSFKYDHSYLEIIDCIFEDQESPRFFWQIKPLKVVDLAKIEVYYHNSLCTSFDITIIDESVNATSCASAVKNLDFAYPSEHIDEINIFNDLATYEDFMKTHNYFGYIKNTPTAATVDNYEYAFLCISSYELGKDSKLNSVFIQNNTLFYDFISTKTYFEKRPDIPMFTSQDYYLTLIRYPSGLNVSARYLFMSYDYIAEE